MIVKAVEKTLAPKGKKGIKGQAYNAGSARIAVINAATRFNRRGMRDELDAFVLRRVVSRSTITYAELIGGERPEGAD